MLEDKHFLVGRTVISLINNFAKGILNFAIWVLINILHINLGKMGEKGKFIKVSPPNIRKTKKFYGKWKVGGHSKGIHAPWKNSNWVREGI